MGGTADLTVIRPFGMNNCFYIKERTDIMEKYKHYNINNVGEEITLLGWASKVRNLGGLIFIDLRNRSGIMQVVVRPENQYYEVAQEIKNEYVIKVIGKIVERESKNLKMATGEIEVEVEYLELINTSKEVPFAITDDTTALEEVSKLYGFPTAAIVSMPEVMEYLYLLLV